MKTINARYAIVIALLSGCAFLCSQLGYGNMESSQRKSAGNRLEGFPLQFAQWKGERHHLAEQTYRILKTDMVLVNRYRNGSDFVDLSVVYYPEMRVEFHPPEGCNSALGDAVESLGARDTAVEAQGSVYPVRGNVFSVTKGNGGKRIFYYFFKSGDFVGDSYLKLRIHMAKNFLRTRETSGAMVVLSTPVVGNPKNSLEVLERFLKEVYPAIRGHL